MALLFGGTSVPGAVFLETLCSVEILKLTGSTNSFFDTGSLYVSLAVLELSL